MTDDEQAELDMLRLANEHGKFAIPLAPREIKPESQRALERLQLRPWIHLIDVSWVAAAKGYCRVFRLTDEAREWVKRQVMH